MSKLGANGARALYLFLALSCGFAGYRLRFNPSIPSQISDALGGITYVVFFILIAAAIGINASPRALATAVLAATCFLEFLQLWHPAVLEAIRSTWPGRLLLGTTFDWSDFPPYFIGALIGWLVVAAARRLYIIS